MYVEYNNNPLGHSIGDCVIRAVAKATGQSWDGAYISLCLQGLIMKDLPNSNAVWGSYLRKQGFERRSIPDFCPDCYTVKDFVADHEHGVFVVATGTHAVCAIDGCYYDIFDSGSEIATLYYERIDYGTI